MEFATKLKLSLISLFLILIGAFLIYQSTQQILPEIQTTQQATPRVSPAVEGEEARVIRVIDGDTIELDGGLKVRLIGINTPETVDPRRGMECFGYDASNETKRLLEGKTVRLVQDISETDRFARLLRYVYLQSGEEEIFINDYLVRNGFAYASSFPPDIKYAEVFIEAEKLARENSRGLWASCKI